MARVTIEDRFRTGKVYTIRQAAVLGGVSPGTVRNWLWGSRPHSPDSEEEEPRTQPAFGTPLALSPYEVEPVFGSRPRTSEIAMVSFLELSEVIVVAKFRQRKIKLQRIRDAYEFARSEWELEYPFAHLNLKSLGGHLLARFEDQRPGNGTGHLVVLSSPGQYVLPQLVQEELAHFDYSDEDKFAARWHPYGRDLPVVVDPRFAGGKPTIKGRGITVEMLYRRWTIGRESFKSIARDFHLKAADVEAVLQRVA